jgi:hypothetical protein
MPLSKLSFFPSNLSLLDLKVGSLVDYNPYPLTPRFAEGFYVASLDASNISPSVLIKPFSDSRVAKELCFRLNCLEDGILLEDAQCLRLSTKPYKKITNEEWSQYLSDYASAASQSNFSDLSSYSPGASVYYYNCFGVWMDGWKVYMVDCSSSSRQIAVLLAPISQEAKDYVAQLKREDWVSVVNSSYLRPAT